MANIYWEIISEKPYGGIFIALSLLCFNVDTFKLFFCTWENWVLETSSQSRILSECWNLYCNFELSPLEMSVGFGVLV